MLKNYLKTAVRYFWTNKAFSLINLIGLSTGICVCFFALLYVHFELSRDSYNKQADNIYRVVTDVTTPSGINYESASGPVAGAMATSFPEVKTAARVFMDDMIIQSNPNNAAKEEIAYADASVFSVFTWPLLQGDARHVFDAPFNVVLSKGTAKKYFGDTDPLGKTMLVNGQQRVAVTGVMQDIPNNSHLKLDMLFSMSTLIQPNTAWNTSWKLSGFYTYLLLKPGTDAAKLAAKFPAFVNAHADQSQVKYKLSLERLKDVYLYGKPRGHRTGSSESGSISNIYIFSVVAIFVLFIACFNFINLTTAFSLKRAQEVGVRKVLGASKQQLVVQFFLDAVLLCLFAFVVALALAAISLPLFDQLSGVIIAASIFEHLSYIGGLLLIAIGVGLLSGIYPALFLSGFKPISTLKGKASTGGIFLRQALVTAQFAISIILIIFTVVVYNQLEFMQNEQLGFKKEHRLVIDYQFDTRISGHTDAIRQQLEAIPGVNSVSFSSSVPGTANNSYPVIIEDGQNVKQEVHPESYTVDAGFLKQYGMTIIAGHGFTDNPAVDIQGLLINEAMLQKLNFKNAEAAIGQRFEQFGHSGTIIGVIKNFRLHSSQEMIQPLVVSSNPGFFTCLTLNIVANNIRNTVDQLHQRWRQLAPGLPLIYFFEDEAYNKQYQAQTRFGQLFFFFSAIAILISCLGLLGLSAFSTAQRKKEIAIRKVLGASVTGIYALLSKDFVKLVLVALVIASPIAWWGTHAWLTGFAYRITVSMGVFIYSGATALMVALVTISFQVVKASVMNPVKGMRNT